MSALMCEFWFGKSCSTDCAQDLLLNIPHHIRKLWLLPGIPASLAALCTQCADEGPVTQAAWFILDLHAARVPTYCCFRPHYQHLLFSFPRVWVTDGLDYQSSQPATRRCFEGTSPWQDVPEREEVGRWDGARVTPPSLVPWLVMAGPPSALHYASALRQMEWSGIQLRKNKQVGSQRLMRCIVSITAQTQATVMLSEKHASFAFGMRESWIRVSEMIEGFRGKVNAG